MPLIIVLVYTQHPQCSESLTNNCHLASSFNATASVTGRYACLQNLLDRRKESFKIHYTTARFLPIKDQCLDSYGNKDLKIPKSKKSEQYFRDKFEIFIRLFDEHFARHFESHWRETWRQIGRRTEPPLSLETQSPPPPLPPPSIPYHTELFVRLFWAILKHAFKHSAKCMYLLFRDGFFSPFSWGVI